VKRNIINILFFGILALLSLEVQAEQKETSFNRTDTLLKSPVHRPMKAKELEKYRADKEFQYIDKAPRDPNLWERIKAWLYKWISKILAFTGNTKLWNYIIYFLFGAVILYLIAKLVGIEVKDIFRPGAAAGAVPFTILEENIHEMNFAELIRQAEKEGQLRAAIRYHYLWTLKQLTDRSLVKWEPGKTNEDYLKELRSEGNLYAPFADLNYFFVYAWYGEFEVNPERYSKISTHFIDFHQQVSPSQP
jgi:hypothetical protein